MMCTIKLGDFKDSDYKITEFENNNCISILTDTSLCRLVHFRGYIFYLHSGRKSLFT